MRKQVEPLTTPCREQSKTWELEASELTQKHLLSRMACSTQEVFSFEDSSDDCWLMADRNLRMSFVLSVLPAPLSPLKSKTQMSVLLRVYEACCL